MTQAGRSVVVAGGSGGIGAAIVQGFVERGDRVVAMDLQTEAEPSSTGVVAFEAFDILDEMSVQRAVSSAAGHLGGQIDVVVAAAGVTSRGDVSATSAAEWDRVMGINCRGPYFLARHAVPFLKAGTDACFVIVASQLGLVGAPDAVAYCASKGGAIQLTRALAIDWAKYGITVNAVCPGPTDTPMLDAHFKASPDPSAERALLASTMLHERLISPHEIAAAVDYLTSPSSRSTNGSMLLVDGGYTVI